MSVYLLIGTLSYTHQFVEKMATEVCLVCAATCTRIYIYTLSFPRPFVGTLAQVRNMIRKQKYSFPLRIDHTKGPDRRYTAATMTTRFQVPDKRSAKHSVARRTAAANAQAQNSSASVQSINTSNPLLVSAANTAKK